MTSFSRTITTAILDWRGILIRITFEPQRFADHLTVETLEPQRAPLPITETGYRSHFMPKNMIGEGSDPASYVEAWLDHAARGKSWVEQEAAIRQYALF